MNKNDKKEVSRWIGQLEEISSAIAEKVLDQEQRFYNLPEGIQDGERGEKMQDAIDNLQSAADSLEETIENLNELL